MKNILYSVLAIALLATYSCSENEQPLFTGEFLQMVASTPTEFSYPRTTDGMGVPSGFQVSLAGALRSNATNYSFEIDPASTAVDGLHYTLDSNSGSVPANATIGELPITILDDNIQPGERLTIVVNLTSADVTLASNFKRGEHIVQVTCDADLSTEFTFVNDDLWMGGPFTGEGTLSLFNEMPGQYKFDDFSFGSWAGVYNIDPPTGSVLFRENCGGVSIDGIDNYGEVWTLTDVFSSGGPEFSFRWENTYGEFGTVTLTKKDGTDWPALSVN